MQIEVFKCIQHVPDRALRTACTHAGAKEIILPKICKILFISISR